MLDITDKRYFSYQITERFLFAMDRIIGNRTLGKITANKFAESVGMKAGNIGRLRNAGGDYCITVEAIGRMCDTYRVSAHWLITGDGDIFANSELTNAFILLEKRLAIIEDAVKAIELSMKKAKN